MKDFTSFSIDFLIKFMACDDQVKRYIFFLYYKLNIDDLKPEATVALLEEFYALESLFQTNDLTTSKIKKKESDMFDKLFKDIEKSR